MKILEINKYNYPKGGADRHFLDITTLLKEKGNEVAIFSMANTKNETSSWEKYFVSYVGYNKNDSTLLQKIVGTCRMFYSFEAKRKIKKLLNDFQPDIVHIHNTYHQISFSIISEIKRRKIPIIITVHDYHLISPDKDEFLENVGKKYWKFLSLSRKYSLLKRLLLVLKTYFEDISGWKDKIDLFISPSLFVAEKLKKWGIEKQKIAYLAHFIPDSKLDEKFEGQKNLPYAFYFGRISKDKGVPELMQTFQKINGIKLYIAGEIEDDTQISQTENIVYLGKLNKEDVRSYIKNASFCISFSKLPETFGLTALESIALGKPFVGLNAGAYREIINPGKTGFICNNIAEAEEKISQIISREIVFEETAIAQIAQEKFGEEKYYQEFMKIIQTLTK
ncbi:MAG: glycosyltransferase family 4 protein [Parcubacteria group bacterium]|jgi:glycosyltransferase involved in cell wall biosynthesis